MARNHDIPLLIGRHRGRLFAVDRATLSKHLYLLGQTGAGKSTLLLNLVGQHLSAGAGVMLIDPHGDLAEAALRLVPLSRAHDLVYFNPSDLNWPIGFNPLDAVNPDARAVVVEEIVAAFVHVWGEVAIGSRTQQVLRNALRALMANQGMSLLAIPKLLNDETFRAHIVARVDDPVCASYWRDQFERYSDHFRAEVCAPLLNKLDPILSGHLRNIVAQARSTIDIRRIMDEEQILIVNLAKGAIGEGTSHLIGALLVTAIANAALSRVDIPENRRVPCHLIADEFQNYVSGGFPLILSESRKFKLTLTLAHQHLGQISDAVRQSVIGNAGSLLAFRLGAEDSPLMARHLGLGDPHPNPSALTELASFQAWGRFLIDGIPSEPKLIELEPAPPPLHDRAHRLKALSRSQFGRDRGMIEEKIRRFLA